MRRHRRTGWSISSNCRLGVGSGPGGDAPPRLASVAVGAAAGVQLWELVFVPKGPLAFALRARRPWIGRGGRERRDGRGSGAGGLQVAEMRLTFSLSILFWYKHLQDIATYSTVTGGHSREVIHGRSFTEGIHGRSLTGGDERWWDMRNEVTCPPCLHNSKNRGFGRRREHGRTTADNTSASTKFSLAPTRTSSPGASCHRASAQSALQTSPQCLLELMFATESTMGLAYL